MLPTPQEAFLFLFEGLAIAYMLRVSANAARATRKHRN
jgi:hypothetical protein